MLTRTLLKSTRTSVAAASAAARSAALSNSRPAAVSLPSSLRCLAPFSTSSSIASDKQSKDDTATRPTMADDPWAIPFQHPDTLPEDIPLVPGSKLGEHPEGRPADEDTETMRARLVYQSRKRGVLEMDLLLSTFIDSGKLKTMSREDMMEYDRLLTLPDWTIYYYAIGKKKPPADSEWAHSKVLAELSKHAANEGKEVRMMPDLRNYGIDSVQQK